MSRNDLPETGMALIEVRQPWRTRNVAVADINRVLVTEPKLVPSWLMPWPGRYRTMLVIELRYGRVVVPYALRRHGFDKDQPSGLAEPENVGTATALNRLVSVETKGGTLSGPRA